MRLNVDPKEVSKATTVLSQNGLHLAMWSSHFGGCLHQLISLRLHHCPSQWQYYYDRSMDFIKNNEDMRKFNKGLRCLRDENFRYRWMKNPDKAKFESVSPFPVNRRFHFYLVYLISGRMTCKRPIKRG